MWLLNEVNVKLKITNLSQCKVNETDLQLANISSRSRDDNVAPRAAAESRRVAGVHEIRVVGVRRRAA